MKKIGTGFYITDIGNFDIIFTPDNNFKELSEEDKNMISKHLNKSKKRIFKVIE